MRTRGKGEYKLDQHPTPGRFCLVPRARLYANAPLLYKPSDKKCMKKVTFEDILKEKMQLLPPEPPPASYSSEPYFDISPLFQVSLNIPKHWPARTYKAATPAFHAETPPTPTVPRTVQKPQRPPEAKIFKAVLNENEQSQWNLFEMTMGCDFGEAVTLSQLKSAFRNFAKKNHPDMSASCDAKYFALGVKIKNELIAVLQNHIKTSAALRDV